MEIYNEVSQKEVENALLDTDKYSSKRWKLITSLDGDKELKKEIDLIRDGISLKFDIRLVLNGFYEELPQMDIVKLRKKQQEDIYEFWDEMEERDKRMKNIIRQLVDETFDNQEEADIDGYEQR